MTGRPTLAELRGRVQKDRHREIGNWLARRVARPTAVYGTWLAVRLGLSADRVTALSLAAGLAASVAIASGSRWGFVAGALIAHLAFWLDHVDGQVARWWGTSSLDGVYLDYLMHHATNLGMGFALGHGLAVRTGQPHWSAAGFLAAAGWAGLSLHNDCRYKAFFQRLKRETRTFRVDGGRGGRPSPPTPWPRRWPGIVTWPAAKACEPHVVLLAVTALAGFAVAAPGVWLRLWQVYVFGMATLAPAVAVGRAVRASRKAAVEGEFDRWFVPWPGR